MILPSFVILAAALSTLLLFGLVGWLGSVRVVNKASEDDFDRPILASCDLRPCFVLDCRILSMPAAVFGPVDSSP